LSDQKVSRAIRTSPRFLKNLLIGKSASHRYLSGFAADVGVPTKAADYFDKSSIRCAVDNVPLLGPMSLGHAVAMTFSGAMGQISSAGRVAICIMRGLKMTPQNAHLTGKSGAHG
jgi:hypothetical protein